ncbi:MAG: hypothetical protein AAGD09_06395 [Cyanobacteria bacterium P01_F01_bin.56]
MTFTPPAIVPLSRLRVSQGLLITAERWQHAQKYQRQRQNLYYQSLHQPGIVHGFGVTAIPVPEGTQESARHHLWVSIAPGIAIDLKGNPIVLKSPVAFGIDPSKLDLRQGNRQTVYLVAQHVDPEMTQELDQPEKLQTASGEPISDRVQEDCRFIQRREFELQPEDVELCRIQLQFDSPHVQNAESVHFPEVNTLDLRHRLTAQARPQQVVKMAQCVMGTHPERHIPGSLMAMTRGTTALFPALQSDRSLCIVSQDALNAHLGHRQTPDLLLEQLNDCQLTHLPQPLLAPLLVPGQERLGQYLKQGGVLLITLNDDRLPPLETIYQELSAALADLNADSTADDRTDDELRSQLTNRLHQVQYHIHDRVNGLCQQVQTFAQQLGYSLSGDGTIDRHHPLKASPFTFSTWPTVGDHPLRLFCWNGIVLAIGPFFELWEAERKGEGRSRPDIRTAQELAINLLHYAWSHHHLTQLQRGETPS